MDTAKQQLIASYRSLKATNPGGRKKLRQVILGPKAGRGAHNTLNMNYNHLTDKPGGRQPLYNGDGGFVCT